jgi:hypothetical protein
MLNKIIAKKKLKIKHNIITNYRPRTKWNLTFGNK